MSAMSLQAAANTMTGVDENDLDESIQKPIRSVRQHYTTPNEEAGAATDDDIKEVKLDRKLLSNSIYLKRHFHFSTEKT